MLGREVYQPQDLLLHAAHLDRNEDPPPVFVEDLEEKLDQTHELARGHIRAAQIKQKRQHDLQVKKQLYHVGDLVYAKDSTKKKGLSPKLQAPWKGPLLVTKCLGPGLYQVRDCKSTKILHHDRLQPYTSEVFSPSESTCHELGDDSKLGTLPKETHYRTMETQRQMAPPEAQFSPSTTPDTGENTGATQTTSRGRVVRKPQCYLDSLG
ncbi:hypothetical protein MHYP_G00280190 [Metynnis hypsauchen]